MSEVITEGNWVHVGTVGVDTGCVMISDAAEKACRAIVNAWENDDFRTDDGAAQISAKVGESVFDGVICESGGSDGAFDVYVRREIIGDSFEVTGLFIDFVTRD